MINQINILFIDKSTITVLSKDEFKQLGCHVDFFEDEVFAALFLNPLIDQFTATTLYPVIMTSIKNLLVW